jgi:effector-binding domain-containing protein
MLPLAAAPKADARLPKGVKVGQSPAGRALEFRHDGPIDDLEEVYARIDDEMSRLGLEAKSILERYDVNALGSEEDRTVLDVWVLVK